MRIVGGILMFLFLFISNASAMDMSLQQEKMCENIIKTMKDHPNFWIIKSYELIYASDEDTVDALRLISYPENDTNAELVLQYNLYHNSEYIHIEKPFEMKFKGKSEERLLLEVKKLIYKQLRDQVGSIVDKEEKTEQNIPIEKPVIKPPVVVNGMSKL